MQRADADLILIHGLFETGKRRSKRATDSRRRHCGDMARYGHELGVVDFERLDGRGMGVANRLLRRMRGTAAPPETVEIFSINESALLASLASETGRAAWREHAGCEPGEYNRDRSFILMGKPVVQLGKNAGGQRLLWFGNGLDHLSRAEFITHYITCHGPLVAAYAQITGLRSYRQVADERDDLCESLRALGLGRATPPAVFGELVVGVPPFSLAAVRERRYARRDIEADEQRHIDFGESMLLLTRRK